MSVAGVIARVRLGGGMILMLYVIGHLSNLALGLWSLDVMEAWRLVIMVPWQSWAGQTLLYGALGSHMVLGLVSLAGRRQVTALGPGDLAQLVLGLAVPPLLALHVLAARGGAILDGFRPSYGWFLYVYWQQAPFNGLAQVLVVSAAWLHGCLGLHNWLKLRVWWPRAAGFVYPVIFLVPILALLGFIEVGKEAIALLNNGDGTWSTEIAGEARHFAAIAPTLLHVRTIFLAVYAAAVVAALSVFLVRSHRHRRMTALVEYVDGPSIRVGLGLSVLEASQSNDVPHASACAGHGRCATCRVRIVAGMENLSPPHPLETELLHRLGLGSDIRLACQALLTGPGIAVERLVPADEEEEAARDPLGWVRPDRPAGAGAS